MKKVQRYLDNFNNSVNNLHDAVLKSIDDLDIDGTIKRFELCYEISWKLIKSYLEFNGIFCKSPRECFKLAVQNNLIKDEMVWMEMIDDRNLLVHTYNFEYSRDVFKNIKEKYLEEFLFLKNKINKEKESL